MIDNFELIKSLLTIVNEDIYYHLQILRRGKDHPELPAANRVIKSYFICSLESLDKVEDEIKKLCEFFGARAYINLTPKSISKTSLLQLKYLSERIFIGDYKKIWKSWNTCAGEIKGITPKWIVDLDDPMDVCEKESIMAFIDSLEPRIFLDPKKYLNGGKDITPTKIYTEIPTKNGVHLITQPFNVQQFKEKYPDIDIHKNNPTVLYIP